MSVVVVVVVSVAAVDGVVVVAGSLPETGWRMSDGVVVVDGVLVVGVVAVSVVVVVVVRFSQPANARPRTAKDVVTKVLKCLMIALLLPASGWEQSRCHQVAKCSSVQETPGGSRRDQVVVESDQSPSRTPTTL
jgi:hypothetical protein